MAPQPVITSGAVMQPSSVKEPASNSFSVSLRAGVCSLDARACFNVLSPLSKLILVPPLSGTSAEIPAFCPRFSIRLPAKTIFTPNYYNKLYII